ncbi:MAG TPA: hypothetical protein VF481_05920 [Novosphingobium sp.]
MTYTILFLEHERVMASTSWDAGLEAAKKYACENLEKRAVPLVEVWDESDLIVFRHVKPQ